MTGLDIEVRSKPGPEASTLEGVLHGLGHRVLSGDDEGAQADLILVDARESVDDLRLALVADRRPTLIIVDRPTPELIEVAAENGHVMVIVDPAASEATLQVAVPVCRLIGTLEEAAA